MGADGDTAYVAVWMLTTPVGQGAAEVGVYLDDVKHVPGLNSKVECRDFS